MMDPMVPSLPVRFTYARQRQLFSDPTDLYISTGKIQGSRNALNAPFWYWPVFGVVDRPLNPPDLILLELLIDGDPVTA